MSWVSVVPRVKGYPGSSGSRTEIKISQGVFHVYEENDAKIDFYRPSEIFIGVWVFTEAPTL